MNTPFVTEFLSKSRGTSGSLVVNCVYYASHSESDPRDRHGCKAIMCCFSLTFNFIEQCICLLSVNFWAILLLSAERFTDYDNYDYDVTCSQFVHE